MNNILIRKMNVLDWRSVDLIELTSGDLTPISDDDVHRYFLTMLGDNSSYHYIIEFNEGAIGHISLTQRPDEWYEIQVIIGETNQWSKGYGSEAINEVLNIAKKQSITKIYLEVRPTNSRAIRSYEKCGFKQVGKINYPKNKYLPETLRMEIIL